MKTPQPKILYPHLENGDAIHFSNPLDLFFKNESMTIGYNNCAGYFLLSTLLQKSFFDKYLQKEFEGLTLSQIFQFISGKTATIERKTLLLEDAMYYDFPLLTFK